VISNSSASAVSFTLGNNTGAGTFNGTIADGNGTVAVTKTGSGLETFGGTNTYTGTTTISGGTLALFASRSIFNSTRISVGSSGTLNVSAAGLELGASQTLAGSGTVLGNVVMNAGAKVQPGTNALKLTVSGNLTLNDNIVVVDLGGVTLSNGLYRLIDYSGSRTGSFHSTPMILNGATTGTATIDHSMTNQINLVVSSAPATPPSFGSVTLSSSNLIMSGSGGTAGGTYYVLTATNIILPAANWPRIATNTFDLSGNFSFTNVMDSAQAGQFFQIMTP
jgi:autotransporter-associated beta strand protein